MMMPKMAHFYRLRAFIIALEGGRGGVDCSFLFFASNLGKKRVGSEVTKKF